jgi:hypothetical protein
VKDLQDKIIRIRKTMASFFSDISEQAKQAQNASALLSRIQSFTFIFSMEVDIGKYVYAGQFDEIARLIQKRNQFHFLDRIELFQAPLHQIDIALRNVENALKDKLKATTLASFNQSHYGLLMDIQRDGNPILDMLDSIVARVVDSFPSEVITHQCNSFEGAIPLWVQMCDFFQHHSAQKFAQCSADIDRKLFNLIRDFNEQNRTALSRIKDRIPPGEQFNTDLHQSVRRTYSMWSIKMPAAVAPLVATLRRDLQDWYKEHLKLCCKVIARGSDPGVKLTTFLLQLLDSADIFSPVTYKELVLEPIYGIYDTFHHNAVVNDTEDLVKAINAVSNLTTKNLEALIKQYNSVVKAELIDRTNDDLIGVGTHLRWIMMEKLLRKLAIELNTAICRGFFAGNIPWAADDVPIVADGYPVLIVSRCIECKCDWGPLYDELKPRIIEHIISSILLAFSNILSLSPTGYCRLLLNLQSLKAAFGKEAVELWRILDDTLNTRCESPPRQLRNQSTAEAAKLERSMRLQLEALE